MCMSPAGPTPKSGTSSRDWPEDFGQENGNYQSRCCRCSLTFFGNKHRVICKTCAWELRDEQEEKGV